MTDNQTMSKPREVTIRRFKLLADSEQEMSVATKGQLEYQHLDINFEYIPMIEKCAYEALKIDNNSWQNCQRKLNEANERIVEFESIKSGHLKIQEEMQKQLAAAKAEVEKLKQELSENQMSCSSQHKADHEYQIELEEELAATKTEVEELRTHLSDCNKIINRFHKNEIELKNYLSVCSSHPDDNETQARFFLQKDLNTEKAKSAKLVELLERAKGTVVTHAMQTYSKVSDRLAAEINEAIAEYSAGNKSSKGDGNA